MCISEDTRNLLLTQPDVASEYQITQSAVLKLRGLDRPVKQYTIERKERDSIDESMIDSSMGSGEGSNGLKNWHRGPDRDNAGGNGAVSGAPNVLLEIDHDTEGRDDIEGDSGSGRSGEEDSDSGYEGSKGGMATSRPLRKTAASKRHQSHFNPWSN